MVVAQHNGVQHAWTQIFEDSPSYSYPSTRVLLQRGFWRARHPFIGHSHLRDDKGDVGILRLQVSISCRSLIYCASLPSFQPRPSARRFKVMTLARLHSRSCPLRGNGVSASSSDQTTRECLAWARGSLSLNSEKAGFVLSLGVKLALQELSKLGSAFAEIGMTSECCANFPFAPLHCSHEVLTRFSSSLG